MENLVFNTKSEKRQLFMKNEKVEILNIDELKQTINAIDFGKVSRTRPVSHFKLIEDIIEILVNAGYKPVIDHIYCAKSSGTKIVPKVKEQFQLEKVLDAWIIDKVTGKIMIPELSNDDVQCCIAFAYHDKGIDVAFGTDVRDCTNMCIYGSDIMHTYGSRKDVNYERMLSVLTEWSHNFRSMFQRNLEIADKMSKINVSGWEMLRFIGKLSVLAIEFNMGMKVVAPLNVTQVAEVTRGIILKRGEKFYEGPECTLWEFYNFMTFVMKGDKADITSLLTDIASIGNMVIREYKVLDIEDAQIVEDEDF